MAENQVAQGATPLRAVQSDGRFTERREWSIGRQTEGEVGMERGQVQDMIALLDAQTDTKFAKLRGDLKALPTRWELFGAVLTLFVAILAILAFAGSRFDSGMSARSAVEAAMSEQHKRDDAQDRKLDEILRRLPEPASPKK